MTHDPQTPRPHAETSPDRITPALAGRAAIGGVLMGMANLVPGISGGTMLVASGVYTRFIDAIGDFTRLRFRPVSVVVLGVIVLAAGVSIGGGASFIKAGLEAARWAMYSLFIGLTLGGVPVMLGLVRPMTRAAWAGLGVGFVVMAGVAVAQGAGAAGGAGPTNPAVLVAAGVVGASAMILPGISGAYLLLLMGQYDGIITAIKEFVSAVKDADVARATAQLGVLVPVGLGVVAGVALVGNVLKFVLHRYEKATLGVLLGLLLGAPIGLYPFKQGLPPRVGDVIKGQTVTEETLDEALAKPKDWPERTFTPDAGHLAGSVGIIAAGIGLTWGLSRLSREKPAPAA